MKVRHQYEGWHSGRRDGDAIERRMVDTPGVSVIIPTFNYGAFITEAIDSVRLQAVEDLEIIVVDDGSTDDTAERLHAVAGHDLKVIRMAERRGVSAARNVGMRAASSPLLAFLDADDRWRKGKLTRQVECLRNEPDVDVVFANFVRFTADGQWLSDQFTFVPELLKTKTRPCVVRGAEVLVEPHFEAIVRMRQSPVWTQTVLLRRSAVEEIWFDEDMQLCEDWHFILRVMRRARGVAFFREPLVEVRRHGANTYEPADIPPAELDALERLKGDAAIASCPAFRWRLGLQTVVIGNRIVSVGDLLGGSRLLVRAVRIEEVRGTALRALLLAGPRWLLAMVKAYLGRNRMTRKVLLKYRARVRVNDH